MLEKIEVQPVEEALEFTQIDDNTISALKVIPETVIPERTETVTYDYQTLVDERQFSLDEIAKREADIVKCQEEISKRREEVSFYDNLLAQFKTIPVILPVEDSAEIDQV